MPFFAINRNTASGKEFISTATGRTTEDDAMDAGRTHAELSHRSNTFVIVVEASDYNAARVAMDAHKK